MRRRAQVFSALGSGSGCALRARYLCDALQRQGWDARLVLPLLPNLPFSLEAFASLPRFLFKAMAARPDLAIGIKPYPNAWAALALARLMGADTVMDVDDLDGSWRGGPAGLLARLAQAPAFLFLNRFSTHHEGIRAALKGKGEVLELDQGVDTAIFHPGKKTRAEKILLFTAHLNVACQLDLLIACTGPWLRQNPSWKLVVAGGGPLLRHFRKKHESPQVAFSGLLSPESVGDWIRRSRICLSAYGPQEGNLTRVPMKCGEYLACGKPVISNEIPGMKKLRRFVYLCRPDAESFGRELDRLSRGRGDGRERRGAAWVRRNLSWGLVARRFLKALA